MYYILAGDTGWNLEPCADPAAWRAWMVHNALRCIVASTQSALFAVETTFTGKDFRQLTGLQHPAPLCFKTSVHLLAIGEPVADSRRFFLFPSADAAFSGHRRTVKTQCMVQNG